MPQIALESSPSSAPALPQPSLGLTRLIAAILLGVLAVSLIASVHQESQIIDEGNHLYAGFMYWRHADFGRNPEHPPLAKLLAALPLLPMGLKEPSPSANPYFKARDFYEAKDFLYTTNRNADAILFRARLVMACFTLTLGLLVFLAAQEMFGNLAALIALTLFAFEPVLLANGAIVTTDMALACLFFASIYTFYRFVRQPAIPRLALCAFVAGLTLVAKHSGFLILPTLLLLALVAYFTAPASSSDSSDPKRRALSPRSLIAALVSIGVVSYIVLWAFYGFRFAARPDGLKLSPSLASYAAGMSSHLEQHVILFCGRHHLLPEAYLFGWVDVLLISSYRRSFVFGHMFPTGQWFFFPGVFLIKSTLTLLVLLALAPFARIRNHRRELLFLAVPVVFFFGAAVASMLNLGVRHLLPIYPLCIVLAAAGAVSLAARNLPARVAVAALVLLTIVSSLHAFPDYLAYSNEIAGGPSHTYQLVEDANDEWGQGLKWTKTYMDQHPASQCWFDSYDIMVDPAYYGIPCQPLLSGMGHWVGRAPDSTPPVILTGTVLLSASDYVGLHYGPGALNPYLPLHNRKPDALIGDVILVYNGSFELPMLAAYSDAGTANALLREHRNAEALARAQHAVQLAPDDAFVTRALADALAANGRAAEADQALARSIHLAQTFYPEYQKDLAK